LRSFFVFVAWCIDHQVNPPTLLQVRVQKVGISAPESFRRKLTS